MVVFGLLVNLARFQTIIDRFHTYTHSGFESKHTICAHWIGIIKHSFPDLQKLKHKFRSGASPVEGRA